MKLYEIFFFIGIQKVEVELLLCKYLLLFLFEYVNALSTLEKLSSSKENHNFTSCTTTNYFDRVFVIFLQYHFKYSQQTSLLAIVQNSYNSLYR